MSERFPNCCGCPCVFPDTKTVPGHLKATFTAPGCCLDGLEAHLYADSTDPKAVHWNLRGFPGCLIMFVLWCEDCPSGYDTQIQIDLWGSCEGEAILEVVSCVPFHLKGTLTLYAGAQMEPCCEGAEVEIKEVTA